MLVMRNFGYLGLHSTISSKSKLARDRLVDFTGDVQVRRKRKDESSYVPDDDCGRVAVMQKWHDDFIAEPTTNGGRSDVDIPDPSSYAQEVASITLLPIAQPDPRKPKQLKMRSSFYTTICNELILRPTNLQNCSKRNITVKVEIVRLLFREDVGALVAIPVRSCIHNSRRGPYLVKEAYTACAYHKTDPYFLDEMKIKLPLTKLKSREHGILVALFTAYHVSVKGKKKWTLKASAGTMDDPSSTLEQIGCGYLSLSVGEEKTYLIADEVHSLHMKYKATPLSSDHIKAGQRSLPEGTKLLEILLPTPDEGKRLSSQSTTESKEGKSCSIDEFLQSSVNGLDIASTQSSMSSISESVQTSDGLMPKSRKASKDQRSKQANHVNMYLNVRTISLSSIHPQNGALEEFFNNMPKAPRCLQGMEFCGVWKERGDEMKNRLDQIQQNFEQTEPNDTRLLQSVIEISKSSSCPQPQLTAHFVRISFQLWRSLVAGSGKPALAYANPAMSLPLRLHSFSTLLHVLNSVSSHLAKSEFTECDGSQKWSLTTMSRVVAILFDEESILLDQNGLPLERCNDVFVDDEEPGTGKREESSADKSNDMKGLGIKSNNGMAFNGLGAVSPRPSLFLHSPRPSSSSLHNLDIEYVTTDTSSPETQSNLSPSSTQDDILLKGVSGKPAPLRTRSFSAPNAAPNAKQLKVDTKSDFQFALTAGASSPSNTGIVSPFGALPFGPAANRRKWLGASASLATISEDHDKIDEKVDKENGMGQSVTSSDNVGDPVLDIIDTEIVLNSSKPTKVKQMRVPKIQRSIEPEEDKQDKKTIETSEDANSVGSDSVQSSKTVPNMDEIETAGTAFLDSIGESYGFG